MDGGYGTGSPSQEETRGRPGPRRALPGASARSWTASHPRLLFLGLLPLLLLGAPLPSAASASLQGVPRVTLSHKGRGTTRQRGWTEAGNVEGLWNIIGNVCVCVFIFIYLLAFFRLS